MKNPTIDENNIVEENKNSREDKFQQLYSLNVNDKCDNRNGYTYLSWGYAWAEFKKVYPNATYNIVKDPQTHLPYFYDENLGIMVYTEVTADELTYQMWLPVMDPSNKAMKLHQYTYQVWNKNLRQYEERKVEAASMFDINKTIMRCLVKNLAMFGLGLYVFIGEDLPESLDNTAQDGALPQVPKQTRRRKSQTPQQQASQDQTASQQPQDRFTLISQAISAAADTKALVQLYQQHQNEVDATPSIKALFTARKKELLKAA